MEEYITTDMALAVYLNTQGHAHQRLERRGPSCGWVFAQVGNLAELVATYHTGDAPVDVQDAMKTGAQLRREMYDFLKGARA